jgi:hypothetical protein
MKIQINTNYYTYVIVLLLTLMLTLALALTLPLPNSKEKFNGMCNKVDGPPLCHVSLNDPNSPHKISNVYPSLEDYLEFEEKEGSLQSYVHNLQRPEINNLSSEQRYRKNDYGTSIISTLQYSSNT